VKFGRIVHQANMASGQRQFLIGSTFILITGAGAAATTGTTGWG